MDFWMAGRRGEYVYNNRLIKVKIELLKNGKIAKEICI